MFKKMLHNTVRIKNNFAWNAYMLFKLWEKLKKDQSVKKQNTGGFQHTSKDDKNVVINNHQNFLQPS